MRWSDHYDNDRDYRRPSDDGRDGLSLLLHAALVFGICLFLASLTVDVLVAAVLSSLLSMASLITGTAALLRGEPLTFDRFNSWDMALAFLALSIASGWLVDPDAIRAYAEAQGLVGAAPGE